MTSVSIYFLLFFASEWLRSLFLVANGRCLHDVDIGW